MKLALVLSTAVLALAAPAAASPFNQLVVFGDSLSDTGNAHLGAPGLGLPDATPASVGYYKGRFSNGLEYIDYLHQRLVGGLATPYLLGGTNYAVGGARAVQHTFPDGVTPYPDLPYQVQLFAMRPGSLPADPNALYVINFGSNDVRAQIEGTADAPTTSNAIGNELQLLVGLYMSGAHHVLLYNVGDLGSEPVFSAEAATARAASLAFDAALGGALGQLFGGPVHTGTIFGPNGFTFTFFDTLAFGDALRADPAKFGLPANLDYTMPCFAVPSALPSCTGYAFADTIHPTSALHHALANATLAALGPLAVPEPATAALFGLGLAGVAFRRRAQS